MLYNIDRMGFKILIRELKEILEPEKDQSLLDLYGGSGLFSVYLAPLFSKVKTVESSKVSSRIVAKTASVNEVTKITSVESDMDIYYNICYNTK